MKKENGFGVFLVELLVAASIMLLLTGMFAVSQVGKQQAADQRAVIAQLQAISQAEQSYGLLYSNGYIPPVQLAAGNLSQAVSCNNPPVLLPGFQTQSNYGYTLTWTAGAPVSAPGPGCSTAGASSYKILATPNAGFSGWRRFYLDANRLTYTEDGSVPTTTSMPVANQAANNLLGIVQITAAPPPPPPVNPPPPPPPVTSYTGQTNGAFSFASGSPLYAPLSGKNLTPVYPASSAGGSLPSANAMAVTLTVTISPVTPYDNFDTLLLDLDSLAAQGLNPDGDRTAFGWMNSTLCRIAANTSTCSVSIPAQSTSDILATHHYVVRIMSNSGTVNSALSWTLMVQ